MNTITGITKIKEKEKGKRTGKMGNRIQDTEYRETSYQLTSNNPKPETRNPKPKTYNIFKYRNSAILFSVLLLIFAFGCAPKQQVQEAEVVVKSDVSVSRPTIRTADRLVNFQGVTRYMQTNDIRAQVTGIIKQINCAVAGYISVNQPLFIIQPQEAAALQKVKFNNQFMTGLSDTVYAHLSGQIKSLNIQVGDFVQIGDVLAICIRSNSMRIIAYIPLEQVAAIEKIKNCTLILPDGTTVDGLVTGKLPAAETQNQTQAYIVEPKKNIALSENVNLIVQFTTEQLQDAVFVPESAVLGNEEQSRFWVMKMMNDSICTKVPVEKGMKVDSLVQVIGSGLTMKDMVVSEGAYGLPDSARVQVTNAKNETGNTRKPAANEKKTSSRH